MSAKKSWFYKLSIAAAVFGLVAISSVLITGEPASQTASPHHVGMVEDAVPTAWFSPTPAPTTGEKQSGSVLALAQNPGTIRATSCNRRSAAPE